VSLKPGSSDWIKAEQAKVTGGKAPAAGPNVSKWLGIGCGIPAALILTIVLLVTLSPKHEATVNALPDKYTQTWSKSYSETTCDDWKGSMTDSQQFAAAADILTSARNKIDGGSGLPPDSLINEFQAGVTNVCVAPSMTITDATYGLYTTEPRFHP
jgi:hypothetical protein